MRVVAGEARGRQIVAPEGTQTRPTSDRVRESIFNMLFSLGVIDDVKALDLYACLLYTSPSPRDLSTSRMPSSA